ncbi:hypothetical protein [Parabacteroides sp.]
MVAIAIEGEEAVKTP